MIICTMDGVRGDVLRPLYGTTPVQPSRITSKILFSRVGTTFERRNKDHTSKYRYSSFIGDRDMIG